jgi:phosphinothricin acetyltransferase
VTLNRAKTSRIIRGGFGRFLRQTMSDAALRAARREDVAAIAAIYAHHVHECTARGFRQMLAVIGDSANAPSIGLHRACGFTRLAVFEGLGWKFERWVDTVLMQRALGAGASRPPDEPHA